MGGWVGGWVGEKQVSIDGSMDRWIEKLDTAPRTWIRWAPVWTDSAGMDAAA